MMTTDTMSAGRNKRFMLFGFVVSKLGAIIHALLFDAEGILKVTPYLPYTNPLKPATAVVYKLQTINYKPFFTFAAT